MSEDRQMQTDLELCSSTVIILSVLNLGPVSLQRRKLRIKQLSLKFVVQILVHRLSVLISVC